MLKRLCLGLIFLPTMLLAEMALNELVREGKIEKLRSAFSGGVSVNAVGAKGARPLHAAARYGQLAIAEMLIGKGADINAINEILWRPIHTAVWFGKSDIVKLLLKQPKLLFKKKLLLLDRGKQGRTPLHVAAFRGNVAIANAPSSAAKCSGVYLFFSSLACTSLESLPRKPRNIAGERRSFVA